jgi:predicted RNA-binding protein Jag
MEGDFREFEAKTVDEAVILAMKTFHVDFEDLEIKIISEGSKGLFGIVGTKSAKILARHLETATKPQAVGAEATATAPAGPVEATSNDVQSLPPKLLTEAKEIVSELLKRMNMTTEVNIREDGLLRSWGTDRGLSSANTARHSILCSSS